jgi:hypothetical protein
MDESELKEYIRQLKIQTYERNALWEILQEFVGRYAKTTDDTETVLNNFEQCVLWRLDRKDDDAERKGLTEALEGVKSAVDRFFSELSRRHDRGEL